MADEGKETRVWEEVTEKEFRSLLKDIASRYEYEDGLDEGRTLEASVFLVPQLYGKYSEYLPDESSLETVLWQTDGYATKGSVYPPEVQRARNNQTVYDVLFVKSPRGYHPSWPSLKTSSRQALRLELCYKWRNFYLYYGCPEYRMPSNKFIFSLLQESEQLAQSIFTDCIGWSALLDISYSGDFDSSVEVIAMGLEDLWRKFGAFAPMANSVPHFSLEFLLDYRKSREGVAEGLSDSTGVEVRDLGAMVESRIFSLQSSEAAYHAIDTLFNFESIVENIRNIARPCLQLAVPVPRVASLFLAKNQNIASGIFLIIAALHKYAAKTKGIGRNRDTCLEYLSRVCASTGQGDSSTLTDSDVSRYFSKHIGNIFSAAFEEDLLSQYVVASDAADALMSAALMGLSLRDLREHYRGAVSSLRKRPTMPVRYTRYDGETLLMSPDVIKRAEVSGASWLMFGDLAQRSFRRHLAQKGRNKKHAQHLQGRKGWRHIESVAALDEICLEHEWCASTSDYYLEKFRSDEVEFWFLQKQGVPVLAMYRTQDGKCEEAKTEYDTEDITHEMPALAVLPDPIEPDGDEYES